MQDGYGSPDTLKLRDIETPVPGDNGVLVEVHAASVNALDWHVARGVLAGLALGACALVHGGRTQGTSSAESTPSQDTPPVGATRVPLPGAYRFDARITEPGRFVARSHHEWQLLWRYLFERAGATAAPPPEIDFSKEMVIVVAMGVRPTTGHLIAVDSVYILGGETSVVVRSETPGQGCGHLMGWTWPVDVVRARRNERAVRFVERVVTRGCQR